jgi:glycosyltransferase involved in cell wall biosynthesis
MKDLLGLRICFLAATLGQGGAERQLYHVLERLRQSGALPRLFCLSQNEFWEGRVKDLGVPIVWIGRSKSKLSRFFRFVAELRQDPPNIVQSQHFYTSAYVGAAGRLLGIPGIGALRSDGFLELKDTGRLGGWVSLRAPKVIVANSRAAIAYAQEQGVPAERMYFLRNVVDTAGLRPGVARNPQVVRLIAVGSLLECKRFDRFLYALARVRREARTPVTGMIVGAGPLRQQLEDQARDLGLPPDAIEFKGSVSDMAPLYSQSDICVLTSDHEGTPNVLLEAMACGLPAVATRVGGVCEILNDGENGFSVDREDDQGLLSVLVRLIDDPQCRMRMGRCARAFVETNHSLASLHEKLLDLYRFALSSPRPRSGSLVTTLSPGTLAGKRSN